MPHKHVEVSQTGFQGVPHEDHSHLHIHRLNEHPPTDKSHYMMTWIADIHDGKPIVGHFFGPTVVYVIHGEFNVTEESKPGHTTKIVAGDVLHIDEASYITWTSPNKGRAFAASWAPTTAHPEDIMLVKK